MTPIEIAAIAKVVKIRRDVVLAVVDINTHPSYRRGALFAIESLAKDICTAMRDVDPSFDAAGFMRACGVAIPH